MAADEVDDEAGSRSWWASPWLWTAVVIVAVGGAVAVSFLGATAPRPDGDDVSAYCPAARAYWRDTALITTLDLNASPETFDRVQASAAEMVAQAPPAIRPDAAVVADGVTQLALKLKAIASRGTGERGVGDIEEAARAVESASRGRDRSATRLAEYTREACGFDLSSPPDVPATATWTPATTTSEPAATTTVGPPVPEGPSGPDSRESPTGTDWVESTPTSEATG